MERIETRLYVESDLALGARVELSGAQAHQLRHVLRLGAGAQLSLFNGRDGAWLARLDHLNKTTAIAEVTGLLEAQRAEPDLWLVFAPMKRHRLDFLIEKATELGAARLCPVLTERSQVRRINEKKLWEGAREAAEQSERLSVPEVLPLTDLFTLLGEWPAGRKLYLCAEAGEAKPLAQALSPGPAAFVTGPEGGYSQRELDALSSLAFVTPVGLGPRILRAETAAIAALSVWQALEGDGRDRPPALRAVAGRALGSEALASEEGE